MVKYATITENGKSVTGVEVDRTDHTALDVITLIATGGLAALGDTTPDTVVVETRDGSLHTGPEKK